MTLTRRSLVAGGVAGIAATALRPLAARATDFAPSAMSLARPAVPERDATGLLIRDDAGADWSLSRLAGQIVVLNLWAPWCLPCRREMPSLASLAQQVAGAGVAVVPVSFDWRGASGVRRFYAETGIDNLPVLTGDGQNLLDTLGLEALPTTAILDKAGRHIQTVAGEARWDDDNTIGWLLSLAA
jgi:thiol-disulfide isomerase/thioredoxin